MRIVAGEAKGRKLVVPPHGVRPTPDRVREALFSSLADRVVDATVLDLFAGSGALGLEALSRGANHATFVEQDTRTAQTLKRNVDTVKRDRSSVIVSSAERVLAGAATRAYTLVFLDPPYDLASENVDRLLLTLAPHLADGATVVVERDRKTAPPTFPAGYTLEASKRYGTVMLYRATWQNGASVTGASEPVENI